MSETIANSARTTLDSVYNLKSPNTLLLFSTQLTNVMEHKDYNLMRLYQLKSNCDENYQFKTVIGCRPMDGGVRRFFRGTHRQGPPIIGDDTALRQRDQTGDRPWDEITAIDLNMSGEQIGTHLRNAISQRPIYTEAFERITTWCNHFEFEAFMIIASGIRGLNNNYEVYNTPQKDVTKHIRDSAEWKGWNDKLPIRDRTRQLTSWQTREQMDGYSVGIKHPGYEADWAKNSNRFNFDKVRDLHDYVVEQNRQADGYDFQPAQIRIPNEVSSDGARYVMKDSYVLFMPNSLALELKKSYDWQTLQRDLMDNMGHQQGITTGKLGMVDNVILVRNSFIPYFKRGENKWSRCLMFGQGAIAMGYYRYNVPVRYRFNKEFSSYQTTNFMLNWNFRVVSRNEGKDSAILGECSFGLQAISFPLPRGTDGRDTYDQGTDITKRYGDLDHLFVPGTTYTSEEIKEALGGIVGAATEAGFQTPDTLTGESLIIKPNRVDTGLLTYDVLESRGGESRLGYSTGAVLKTHRLNSDGAVINT